MDNLVFTKVARKVIRSHSNMSYAHVYTNKYKNCRTVKVNHEDRTGILRKKIDAALIEAGSTDHSMKIVTNKTWYGNSSSLIVRLPN